MAIPLALLAAGTGLAQGGLGIVGSIIGGNQQAKAARQAMQAQIAALGLAGQQAQAGALRGDAILNPFTQIGLQAGGTLSSLFVSPEEQAFQRSQIRSNLQGDVDRLQRSRPANEGVAAWVQRAGGNYHLAGQLFRQAESQWNQEFQAAQAKLTSFDEQSAALEARAQAQAESGDDRITRTLEESPAYRQAAKLANRQLAAQGLIGSEKAIRQQGALAAELVAQQTSGLQNLFGIGAQTAGQQAGLAAGAGQFQAGITQGVGQATAQGALGQGAARAGMTSGITDSISGGLGSFLNVLSAGGAFRGLFSANQGGGQTGGGVSSTPTTISLPQPQQSTQAQRLGLPALSTGFTLGGR